MPVILSDYANRHIPKVTILYSISLYALFQIYVYERDNFVNPDNTHPGLSVATIGPSGVRSHECCACAGVRSGH